MTRVVVTLTTIPSGIPGAIEVVEAFLKEKEIDMIYLNWPYTLAKSGERYPDPVFVGVLVDPKVKVNRCSDLGPITKVFPVLDLEKDPSTKILIVDDDHLPEPGIVSKFIKHSNLHPDAALTTGGWVKGSGIFSYQTMSKDLERIREVDWVEGAGGIIVPRKFLDRATLLNYSKAGPLAGLFKKHDDHWLSWHLRTNGAVLLSIPEFFGDRPVRIPKKESISGDLNFYKEVYTLSSYLAKMGIYQTPTTWSPIPVGTWGFLIVICIGFGLVGLWVQGKGLRSKA